MMSVNLQVLLEQYSPALRNHLWQSTAFGAVIALVNMLLRKNEARIRYWLWLAGSLKFFVPFSFLMALGDSMLARRVQQSGRSEIVNVIQQVATPFVSSGTGITGATDMQPAVAAGMAWSHIIPALMIVWLAGFLVVVLVWLRAWIQVARMVHENEFLGEGREIDTLRKMSPRKWPQLRISSSKTLQQPGVYGMFRPVLIWPQAVSERIDDAQMRAIFAHELCHVRCFDNLCAMLHMLVEAVFWFHPMVWWLGRKLEEERERACDEDVLALKHAPKVYAESILKVCELCVTPEPALVAGVTGADLKHRIAQILQGQSGVRLAWPGRLLLSTFTIASVATPLLLGQTGATEPVLVAARVQSLSDMSAEQQSTQLPKYDVSTVRPNNSGSTDIHINVDGAVFEMGNTTIRRLLQLAYDIRPDLISGLPPWAESERFDIKAKVVDADPETLKSLTNDQVRVMARRLIMDRFHLETHTDTKTMAVYDLVVAKSGVKFKPSLQAGEDDLMHMHGMQVTASNLHMKALANYLSRQTDRVVIDKTGLPARYDLTLKWSPDLAQTEHSDDAPPLFTALQDQLGLKLQPSRGPVPTLVIDHIERPKEN